MKNHPHSKQVATARRRNIGAAIAALALVILAVASTGCDKVLLGTDVRQTVYGVFQSGLSAVSSQLQSDISTAVQNGANWSSTSNSSSTSSGSGK